jgi:hypothetical protein
MKFFIDKRLHSRNQVIYIIQNHFSERETHQQQQNNERKELHSARTVLSIFFTLANRNFTRPTLIIIKHGESVFRQENLIVSPLFLTPRHLANILSDEHAIKTISPNLHATPALCIGICASKRTRTARMTNKKPQIQTLPKAHHGRRKHLNLENK